VTRCQAQHFSVCRAHVRAQPLPHSGAAP
jgi:hypothetical protein